MAKKPEYGELEKRISTAVSAHDGSLPREDVIAWRGYLAALIEWGLISIDEHFRLIQLMPHISDDPSMRIFLGYGNE